MNRPKALNALCNQIIEELNHALGHLNTDSSIGAIVITGSEKAFAAGKTISTPQSRELDKSAHYFLSSGADIKEMQNNTYSSNLKTNFIAKWNGISKSTKPMIAAVNGYAVSKCKPLVPAEALRFVESIRYIYFPCTAGRRQ